MAHEASFKVELGFDGGLSLPIKMTEADYKSLVAAIKSGAGWETITADGGEMIIDTKRVVYSRREPSNRSAGF